MLIPKWTELELPDLPKKGNVEAPWVFVTHELQDFTHLLIEAGGTWSAQGTDWKSGPNGVSNVGFPEQSLILPQCWFAALIGKLGGSTASHGAPQPPPAELAFSEPFAIGEICIQKLPLNMAGPLFIGFNCAIRPIHIDELTLKISGARVPAEPEPKE